LKKKLCSSRCRVERREQALDERAPYAVKLASRDRRAVARATDAIARHQLLRSAERSGGINRVGQAPVNKKVAGEENRHGKDTGTVVKGFLAIKPHTYVCCITACEFLSRFAPRVRL
jgi:hypothetical protein